MYRRITDQGKGEYETSDGAARAWARAVSRIVAPIIEGLESDRVCRPANSHQWSSKISLIQSAR